MNVFPTAPKNAFEGLAAWSTGEAAANGQAQSRTAPGGRRRCSDPANETALTLRAAPRMALRRTEGLTGPVMRVPEIGPPFPSHSALSRRACGPALQTKARVASGAPHLIVGGTGLKSRGDARRATGAAIAVRSPDRMRGLGQARFVRVVQTGRRRGKCLFQGLRATQLPSTRCKPLVKGLLTVLIGYEPRPGCRRPIHFYRDR